MRIAGLFALALLLPVWAQAAIVINEIAWMGTTVSANAEWIELYNPDSTSVDLTNWHLTASSGSPSITLAGSITAGGYFLLERTSDASVPSVTADQIYTGALTNSGTTLTLSNASGNTINQVDGGANWATIGGDNASKETAQRTSSGWETAAATPRASNAGVSASSGSQSQVTSTTTSTTAETTSSSSGNGLPEYVPIPILRIIAGSNRVVSSGADTAFTAIVYDGKGNRRDDAQVTWSFGDGMQKTGASMFHTYYDPGEYLAVVHAFTSDGGDALAQVVVTVEDANIQIASVSSRGVSLRNNSSRTLDLSFWRLVADRQEFKIPENTHVLAGHTVPFSSRVTKLPTTGTVSLLYPDGEVAVTYPTVATSVLPNTIPQPSSAPMSYKKVSEVEPIPSARTDVQKNEEAVSAPATVTELAAAGAVLSPALPPEPVVRTIPNILKSPWTLSFLGVLALAGSAFIFL